MADVHVVDARFLFDVAVVGHFGEDVATCVAQKGVAVLACVAVEHGEHVGGKVLGIKFLFGAPVHDLSAIVGKHVASASAHFQAFSHSFDTVCGASRSEHHD